MEMKKPAGLFINCVEARDSIYESGKMAFECLSGSEKYSLDYAEITPDKRTVPAGYDFYFFNYHQVTMSWLDVKSLKKSLPGLKITMVLEVAPNNPFVYCSPDDFDVYIVLDPTLHSERKNVFAFPRPLEKVAEPIAYRHEEIPVIGSFGFATTGKGFEHVVDAVSREFDKALVRINIPYATYADESRSYAAELAEMCRERAKPGVEVIVTHDFMSKTELIEWCGQNTLNCFLYDRNLPGLAATTDQAITSGRPLITSKNNTFRHIQKYIKPFPYQSLTEAIANSQESVRQIQHDWSAENFRRKFEEVLDKFQFGQQAKTTETIELKLLSAEKKSRLSGAIQNLRNKAAIKTRLKEIVQGKGLRRGQDNGKNSDGSYSQFGEDLIIDKLFDEIPIKNSAYLDIGANNPKFISNTYFFYEKGSRGVLVEPSPRLCEKLKQVRPEDKILNFGIGIDENIKEADFYMFPEEADGLSTFSPEEAEHWQTVGLNGRRYRIEKVLKMPLLGINEVIEKYFTECPDFISIDVEGWDLQILKTFDFEKYSPAVFCVETLAYRDDGSMYRKAEIQQFLEDRGYFSFQETYANTIFVNRNLYDFYLYQKDQTRATKTDDKD